MIESKPQEEAGLSTCATLEHPTPTQQQSPSSVPGFLGFFSAFSCCVSSRKMPHHSPVSEERSLGTGARSRERKYHKPRHAGHQHLHKQGAPIIGNPDVVNPTNGPSSGTSSASMKSSPMLENWMDKFADWRLVDIPVFPGTHHSGVNNPRKRTSQPVWGWAKCQDLGIEEQLYIGVRFLDLRIRVIPKTGEVLISHGLTSDTSLADALEVVATFLDSHATEGVILYIRPDKWHGIDKESSDLLSTVIRKSSVRLCQIPEPREAALKELRVRNIAGTALIVTPEETFPTGSVPFVNATCLQYCDIWQANSIEEAKAKIETYMTQKTSSDGNVFGGVALDGTFPIRQQSQTSRELNQWFIEKLSSDDKWKDRIELSQFGIVLIDFADFDVLTFLIGINNKLMSIRASS